MSYNVTPEERRYLQFQFGLLTRVIVEEGIATNEAMHLYESIVTEFWQMTSGEQTTADLAAIHARAAGAYESYGRRVHGALLEDIVRTEAKRYQGAADALSPERYGALIAYVSFFQFFAMTLALMLRGSLDAAGLRRLHAELLPTEEERRTFQSLVEEQCAAMALTPQQMADLLLAAGDPAARPRDAQKVAIITCVNDEVLYDDCRTRLEQLVLPAGVTLDFVPVRGAPSMCAGYTEGMVATDAKYKLYLHQDMLLAQPNLLMTLLPYLSAHPEVGLVGLAGSRRWRTNGIWWEDPSSYLHLDHGAGAGAHRLDVGTMEGDWQRVAMLDGIFLLTQVDVPWRADLFRGWHFYDASACAEFRRAGYAAVIPRQDAPRFRHVGGTKKLDLAYHYWRQVFLEEYGKDLAKWQSEST